jgi:hypothetical protein
LKEARNKGHRAVIQIDKLIVNGRPYELKYMKDNIKLTSENKTMITPAMEVMTGKTRINSFLELADSTTKQANTRPRGKRTMAM